MSSFSTTTVRERDVTRDEDTEPVPGLALVYSCWHRAMASAFPFYNSLETLGRDASNSIAIPDEGVSRFHARFERRADGRTWVVDCNSTNGTRINGRRVEQHPLAEHDVLRVGDAMFRYVARRIYAHSPYRIDGSVVAQARPFAHGMENLGLVGGYQIDATVDRAARLARGEIGIVIQGESGTGKELVAAAIHQASGRLGTFIAVNCGAIPETLAESELFGHRRGAFTGAHADRVGLVAAAHRGTLFLDEVGDMPLTMQGKLLRVLQEREVLRLGDTRATAVDLRVVCATHRDLDAMVASGTFRGDLYARLRDIKLQLPALRERREDLYSLVKHFAAKYGRPDVEVTHPFMIAVAQYGWPLNIRELESAVRVAVTLSAGRPLDHPHLPEVVRRELVRDMPRLALAVPLRVDPTKRESARTLPSKPTEEALRELLARKRGNVAAVARTLRVHRMQLYRWMKHYQLDAEPFR